MSQSMTWDEAIAELTGPEGQYPISEAEIFGQKHKVFAKTPPSLTFLWGLAHGRGDQDFLVYEDERWTFGQVGVRIDALASALVERYGIEKGDRVAISMRNYPEYIVSFAAITSVGAIAVCLNSWWTRDEVAYGLEDCGAQLLIADPGREELARPSLERLGIRGIAVRPQGDIPGFDAWSDVVVEGAVRPDIAIDPDDDAMILYTSGTTGHPKGAVSSHRAILSALLAFACRAAANKMLQPEKEESPHPTSFILTVPLFHVTGLVAVTISAYAAGNKLVMMYKWNPERALELIERERVTQFVGVPTMSWDLLESPDFGRRDTSSLAAVGGGGAPAPPELVQRIDKAFERGRPGIGYGMTETNAYGPQNAGADYLRKPRSAGRAVPTMQVKVADDDGNEVATGEIGEIWFRGPNLIRGYWNKPEATAETIVDGWLRSGDLGRLDDEGFIYVEDRAKDMVLRAGENVYSAEVEAAIYEHPAVYEAAVFGLPHERLGEEVTCAIVPKPGQTIDPEELRQFVGQRIAAFKVPSVVELYDESLPRNASGKILKRSLRDELVARREG